MKKIGILFGQERSFPQAFVDKVNSYNIPDIQAEFVQVEAVQQGKATDYAVIIDRISQDVPFYRAYLKNAALMGTAVINNPFWWSADEKFFNNCLMTTIGIDVPKTVLLPSKERPTDTSKDSFSNLKSPWNWDYILDYLGGFPLYMKPYAGGGWKSVYKVHDFDELWKAYDETEQLVMMLQETIDFTAYFRCYCLNRKYIKIMHYEPRNPHESRYVADFDVSDKMMKKIYDGVMKVNQSLGYDFNTVEFAIRDGVPYAIDFCNPAPDAEITSVGQDNFDWVVEHAAKMAIERAQEQVPGAQNLTWGSFMQQSVKSFNKRNK